MGDGETGGTLRTPVKSQLGHISDLNNSKRGATMRELTATSVRFQQAALFLAEARSQAGLGDSEEYRSEVVSVFKRLCRCYQSYLDDVAEAKREAGRPLP